jgi:hypothetical protein
MLVGALVLLAVTGGAALAHVDSLGVPDPYWQAGNVSTTSAGVPNGGADGGGAVPAMARFFKGCVYASGGVAVLLLLSLLRMLGGSKQRSWD